MTNSSSSEQDPQLRFFLRLFLKNPETAPKKFPLVTWLLMGACTLVACQSSQQPGILQNWGFWTQAPLRHLGLTLITPFFLHAGWGHLILNMWAFWLYGGNVEEFLGRKRYLALLAVATMAGHLLVWALPIEPVLLVGASGGIFAVICFYVYAFPDHQMLSIFSNKRHWPAWRVGMYYFVAEVGGVIQQLSGDSKVSSLSHLAGAGIGYLCYLIYRREIAAAAASAITPAEIEQKKPA